MSTSKLMRASHMHAHTTSTMMLAHILYMCDIILLHVCGDIYVLPCTGSMHAAGQGPMHAV